MGPRRDVVGGGGGTGYHSKPWTNPSQDLQKTQIYDVGPRWLSKVLIFSFFKILLFIGFLLRAVFPFINEWWFWNLVYVFVSQIYHWYILITWPLKTRSKVLLFKGLLTDRRKFEKKFWSTKHYFIYQNSVLSCFWLQSIIPE